MHAIDRTRLLFAAALGYTAAAEHSGYGLTPPPRPDFLRGHDNLAVLLHGTTWPSKRWPARYWAELARNLVGLGYQPALPWSDEHERAAAESIAAAAPPSVVLPRSTLPELAGLLAASRLVVGVDTGLMHLAAAFGVPTISIFSSTSPDLTGPVGSAASVVLQATTECAPCRQRVCPRVPVGVEPPCQATVGPYRVLAERAGGDTARLRRGLAG
jgi:heptosyltransferase-1